MNKPTANERNGISMIRMTTCALMIAGVASIGYGSAAPTDYESVITDLPTSSSAAGRKVAEELVVRGQDAIAGMFAALQPPGSGGKDIRVRYAIQAVASHVSRPGAEREQKMFSAELVKALAAAQDPNVKQFLVEQFEWAGTKKDASVLVPLLKDPKLVHIAVRALFRVDKSLAAKEIPTALESATSETRPMLLQALGKTGSPSVLKLAAPYANDEDPHTRLNAQIALAETGSPDAAKYLPKLPADPTTFAGGKELSVMLLYARKLAAAGHANEAVDILRPLVYAAPEPGSEHVQCAALGSLTEILGAKAQPFLAMAMNSPALEIRAAALRQVLKLKGSAITQAWINQAKASPALQKAEIIEMLGNRGDKSAIPSITAGLADTTSTVRLAAITALARLADQESVKPLLEFMTDAPDNEIKAVRIALSTVEGKDINSRIGAASKHGPASVQTALFETLAARGATDQIQVLLHAAQESEPSIRTAALKACENLATPVEIPQLVAVMLKATEKAEQSAAQKAIASAGRKVSDPNERIIAILDAWKPADADRKVLLLETAAKLGGDAAMGLLVDTANGDEQRLRDSAVRLIADWPDRAAAPELLKIARVTSNDTQRVLALRGFLRLADAKELSAEAKLGMYRSVLEMAKRPEEKKLAVAAAGGLETTDSLQFVTAQLTDDALKQDAAQSIYRITVPQAENDSALSGEIATAALSKAVDLIEDKSAADKAREHLKKSGWKEPSAQTTSDEKGFVTLFNGKDLDGWIGDVANHKVENGLLVCPEGTTGSIFAKNEYTDFHVKFEFRLTPGANSGLGIRSPLEGVSAFEGMEIQILDDTHEKWATLQPWQMNGGVYGIAAAEKGHLKPVGDWNSEEVIARGDQIQVVLNGKQILDVNLKDVTSTGTLDGQPHPGLKRSKGYVGFLGHHDRVEFRSVAIKEF